MYLISNLTYFSSVYHDASDAAPTTRVKGSSPCQQLQSQLDEVRVGDHFTFQPNFEDLQRHSEFDAVFVEEVTLQRIAYKMQVR